MKKRSNKSPDVSQVERFIDYVESQVGQKLLGQKIWLELVLILREELKCATEAGVFDEQ